MADSGSMKQEATSYMSAQGVSFLVSDFIVYAAQIKGTMMLDICIKMLRKARKAKVDACSRLWGSGEGEKTKKDARDLGRMGCGQQKNRSYPSHPSLASFDRIPHFPYIGKLFMLFVSHF